MGLLASIKLSSPSCQNVMAQLVCKTSGLLALFTALKNLPKTSGCPSGLSYAEARGGETKVLLFKGDPSSTILCLCKVLTDAIILRKCLLSS